MASPNSADPKPDSVVEAMSIGEAAWGRLGLPLGLFAVALALRLSPWQGVFHSDGIGPQGTDAYYHLRRIQYAIDHFPGFLSFDPFINFSPRRATHLATDLRLARRPGAASSGGPR